MTTQFLTECLAQSLDKTLTESLAANFVIAVLDVFPHALQQSYHMPSSFEEYLLCGHTFFYSQHPDF